MNSIDQTVSECMSANGDNFLPEKQVRKSRWWAAAYSGGPDLHRILNRYEVIMNVKRMSVQLEECY